MKTTVGKLPPPAGYARTAGIPLSQVMSSKVTLLAIWALARVAEPSAANPPRRARFAKNSRRGESGIAVLHSSLLNGLERCFFGNLKEAGGANPGPYL